MSIDGREERMGTEPSTILLGVRGSIHRATIRPPNSNHRMQVVKVSKNRAPKLFTKWQQTFLLRSSMPWSLLARPHKMQQTQRMQYIVKKSQRYPRQQKNLSGATEVHHLVYNKDRLMQSIVTLSIAYWE